MADEKEAKPVMKRRMVFIGFEIRYNDNLRPAELFSKWLNADKLTDDGRSMHEAIKSSGRAQSKLESSYSEKLAKGKGQSGSIWEFEAPDDTHVFLKSGKYVGRWQNEDDCVRWESRSMTQKQEWELNAEQSKERDRKFHLERLEPLRHAYRNLGGREQGVFLARVLAYIVGGSAKGRGTTDTE